MSFVTVELQRLAEVGPRGEPLAAEAPFVPMDAVTVGLRYPTYTEPRRTRGGIRAKANDVLFARITPCLENGKVAQLPGDAPLTGGSTEFLVLRPGPELDPAFLYYWSLAPHTRDRARAMMTGTTGRMRLSGKVLATFPIPAAPLPQQRRIVEILEDHLSRLYAAGRDLTRASNRLKSLDESALRQLVAADAPTLALRDVLEAPLSNGRSVPTKEGGFPVLRLTALKDAGVDLSERKEGAWSRAQAARFLVAQGDFLIARGNGSLRLVGRGSLIREKPDEVAFPDTAIRARPRSVAVLPEYFDIVWNSRRTRDQIESVARTSAGIYKVNQGQLEEIRLPVPPLSDQRRVIAIMVTWTNSVVSCVKQSMGRSDARTR